MFATASAVAGAGIAAAGPGLGSWGPGLGIWALSLLWGMAVYRGYLTPRVTGMAAAGIGLLIGAQLVMEVAAGQVLALLTVAGMLAGGVALRQVWVLGLGAAGVLLVVPQTASRYLPATAAAPVAVFVIGVVLLGSALWLARGRGHGRSGPRPRTR